jgi:hypothetical protein
VRLTLKGVTHNDGDFVEVVLLYPSTIHIRRSRLEAVFTCLFNDAVSTFDYKASNN